MTIVAAHGIIVTCMLCFSSFFVFIFFFGARLCAFYFFVVGTRVVMMIYTDFLVMFGILYKAAALACC